ncbi:hypothetical protein [Geobacter sp. SVR]|uniref:hypothetical protein n=1 Tax=Geobacter sp. SVR TaxID=2495594 RepID=UPI00143EF564|nr:hypothetical protein [Geobacter sp. SVR]BCS54069.1 hypothetical protein GSVR_23770 [Geobacter sp. SVR]GCF87552.1 hypothetical protein GSbR_41520 [Geobacter sp. SVR]
MQIAFYKGKGNLWDWVVRKWTGSPYSHCELVFSDGPFFSADPRSNGVRYLTIEPDPAKWDFIDIEISLGEEKWLRRWSDVKVGCGYDWVGLFFGTVLHLGLEDIERYFCSEICSAALQALGRIPEALPSKTNPGELYELLRS